MFITQNNIETWVLVELYGRYILPLVVEGTCDFTRFWRTNSFRQFETTN